MTTGNSSAKRSNKAEEEAEVISSAEEEEIQPRYSMQPTRSCKVPVKAVSTKAIRKKSAKEAFERVTLDNPDYPPVKAFQKRLTAAERRWIEAGLT